MRLSSKPRVNQIPPKLDTSSLRFASLRLSSDVPSLVGIWLTLGLLLRQNKVKAKGL